MAQEINVRGIARTPFGAGDHPPMTTVSGSATVTLDLDDGHTRRVLQNERARFVVMPDLYPSLQSFGALSVAGTASGLVWRAPRAGKLTAVTAQVGAAPSGGDVVLDVVLVDSADEPTAAGTSVFTDDAHKPTVADGEYASTLDETTGAGYADNQEFAAGDYLRVEIESANSAEDLTVQFIGY